MLNCLTAKSLKFYRTPTAGRSSLCEMEIEILRSEDRGCSRTLAAFQKRTVVARSNHNSKRNFESWDCLFASYLYTLSNKEENTLIIWFVAEATLTSCATDLSK